MDEKDKRIKKLKLQLAHERRKVNNLVEWVDNVFKKESLTGDRYLSWRRVSNKCRYSHVARMSARYRPQPPRMDAKPKPTLSIYLFDEGKTRCLAYTEPHARRILSKFGSEDAVLSRVEPLKQKQDGK